ncbi:hypothetical protein [Variovorax sp. WS11]
MKECVARCTADQLAAWSGTIFFTGATASLSGAEGYSAFSGTKH